MLPKNVVYYGKEAPLPEQVPLRAGPLTLIYETDQTLGGNLRYVKLGNREILRRIYVAIRDHVWGTVPAKVANVQLAVEPDAFQITCDVEHKADEIDFFWHGTLTGDAEGTITFTMDGVARASFLRNRIGFCVLHPMGECAGQPCLVEHPDGPVERGTFPVHISPHQPFKDIRTFSHQVMPDDVWAQIRFAGDVFEMEDQRNWTDASFKTYSTPLALPFPVEIEAGTEIRQSVTLTLEGQAASYLRAEPSPEELTFSIDQEHHCPLPRIGLGSASDGKPLSDQALTRLAALNLAHLRVDLHLSHPGYEARLRRAAAESQALRVPLEVALFLSDAAEDELPALLGVVEEIKPSVCTWLVFHVAETSTREHWVRLVRRYLAPYDSTAMIGSGTNNYFTELNRNRPPVEALDAVCYSLNPQVHTFDNAALVEALATQAVTVESARQFAGDRPIVISPITLKPRFVPGDSGSEQPPEPGDLPPEVDERQMSLFGAGWTVGSLKYIAQSNVHGVTYYETVGWRGVMERASGSPLPDRFYSQPGMVFPMYHVLADVGEFAGGNVIASSSTDPLRVDGLVLHKNGATRILLANMTAEPQCVILRGMSPQVRIRMLDDTTVETAMLRPEEFRHDAGELVTAENGGIQFRLHPFAVARLENCISGKAC